MDNFVPAHYHISLTPDLSVFRFRGRVHISGSILQPAQEVVLHALELDISSCSARIDGSWEKCDPVLEPDKELVRIRLPKTAEGQIQLRVEYTGLIGDRMAGFYRSRYRDAGQERYIAVTQFQESDARRAFPCQDHPRSKATFDVEMVVDRELTAISNGTVREVGELEEGKKCVRFTRTPRMSTYLLFFGVGAFEVAQDESDERVRAATIPQMSPYARYGLEFGRKSLHYCEKYFRIPYPLPKMDLIAIPDFAFGAMENWGAITFRENLLLHYPDITSRAGEERICEVIAHEIVHQWFGNLVTPSDWKYLWLNESFATFFAYGVVDHYYPAWGIWEQFISGQTATAFSRDALIENVAIEIPGGEHVIINASTAPIIYSKGGSILRQIKGAIGEEKFRQGLQLYLNRYAYGNAASHHLWEAFEEAADQPIARMMQSWIGQPGHPLVTARRDGRKLILQQQRFTFLPGEFDQRWEIPVNIRLFDADGKSRTIQSILAESRAEIELHEPPAAYLVNVGRTGFYRVRYVDPENLEKLGRLIRQQALSSEDRWGIENDCFALVRRGDLSLRDYLDLLGSYAAETSYLPLVSIADNLFSAFALLQTGMRSRVADTGKKLFESALEKIGFEPQAGEAFTTSLLRDHLLLHAVYYGSEQVERFSRSRFAELVDGQDPHPDIMKSILQIGAWTGGDAALDWLTERFRHAASEHERMNILAALGCFSEDGLNEQALQFVLDEVPDRNKFVPIVAACNNPNAQGGMWNWYLQHRQQLEQFHPLLYERVIAAVIPSAGVAAADEIRSFFQDYSRQRPQVRDVVRLALEKLQINLKFRERNDR